MADQETAPHAGAVVVLFAERYGQLVGYARKRLRAFDVPPAWVDAEDVVQNALASVLARSDPVEKLSPYVFTVIKNEVWQATQRYRAGQGYGSRDADVRLEAAGPFVDSCGAVDLRLDVRAALSALPPQQRTAVLCDKVLGLTQAETAQAMGKSPGTVATHTSRAMATLKLTLAALAVVLVGWAVQWLRPGTLPIVPAAGGGVVKALLSLAWWWWIAAGAVVASFVGVVLGRLRPFARPRLPGRPGRAEREEEARSQGYGSSWRADGDSLDDMP
ncbi:sigma-70 family RNA polymerase sigma factor [Streptomyces sp. NPDC008240]|uniref:RNA polymerase sigma factor n=1 Tax=Streptomyces sp. NPDC008240 TaxID=3364822 RepID=UPI0036E80A19